MSHVIEIGEYLCYARKFVVNGQNAQTEEFGVQRDIKGFFDNDTSCGDMHFTPKKATREVLRKYSINKEEYDEICSKLEDGLSFGRCDFCS